MTGPVWIRGVGCVSPWATFDGEWPFEGAGLPSSDTLAAIERKTGVAQHVIVGILGVETYYGRITGKDRVLDALATLAFDYPSRSKYFRAELEQYLLLAREEQFDTRTLGFRTLSAWPIA